MLFKSRHIRLVQHVRLITEWHVYRGKIGTSQINREDRQKIKESVREKHWHENSWQLKYSWWTGHANVWGYRYKDNGKEDGWRRGRRKLNQNRTRTGDNILGVHARMNTNGSASQKTTGYGEFQAYSKQNRRALPCHVDPTPQGEKWHCHKYNYKWFFIWVFQISISGVWQQKFNKVRVCFQMSSWR